jgi:tetratricopeptide (TPR) repeat protein
MTLRSSARAPRLLSAALAAILLVELAPPRAARAEGGDPDPKVQAVESLTNQAYELTAAGKFSEAIAAYMKAYEISKAGAILFNIATIYDRRMHERALAMEYLRRYLQATDAEPEFARKATERLSALKIEEAREAQVKSSVQVAPPPAAPVQPAAPAPALSERAPSTEGSALRPLGLVVGGIGIVGIGSALALGAVAMSKNTDASLYCSATSCSSSQGVTFEHQAGDVATAATATFIAGASLLAIGVTVFVVAPRRSSASIAIRPRVGMSSGSGMVTLEGTF